MELLDSKVINMTELRKNNVKVLTGLIAPATEQVTCELAPEHAAEPIKSMDDIFAVQRYLLEQERYRDNMLFVVGINFGLRVSDLRQLRFSNLIADNFVFKDSFAIFEKKTRNTRKRKKNRYITINHAVVEAVTLYLEHTPNVTLSDYMFRSQSNRCTANVPLSNQSIDRLIKEMTAGAGLSVKASTHLLRKTFCYHQMVMSNNDSRKLMLLQKMLGHSTPAQTLDYIGITGEEIEEAYKALNLGSKSHNYLVDSNIVELDVRMA